MRTKMSVGLLLTALILACGGPPGGGAGLRGGPKKHHHHHHHHPQVDLGEIAKFDGKCKESTPQEKKLETKGDYFLVLLVDGDCPVTVSGLKGEDPKEYEPGTTLGRGFAVPDDGLTLKFACKTSEKEENCKFTAWAGVPGKPPEGQAYTYVTDHIEDAKCDGGEIKITLNGQATVEVTVAENACKLKVSGTDNGKDNDVDSTKSFSDKVSPDSGTPWKDVTITCDDDPDKKCDFTYAVKKQQ